MHSVKRLVIQLQHQLLYLDHLVRMLKLSLEVAFSDHLLANNNLIHVLALDLLRFLFLTNQAETVSGSSKLIASLGSKPHQYLVTLYNLG